MWHKTATEKPVMRNEKLCNSVVGEPALFALRQTGRLTAGRNWWCRVT